MRAHWSHEYLRGPGMILNLGLLCLASLAFELERKTLDLRFRSPHRALCILNTFEAATVEVIRRHTAHPRQFTALELLQHLLGRIEDCLHRHEAMPTWGPLYLGEAREMLSDRNGRVGTRTGVYSDWELKRPILESLGFRTGLALHDPEVTVACSLLGAIARRRDLDLFFSQPDCLVAPVNQVNAGWLQRQLSIVSMKRLQQLYEAGLRDAFLCDLQFRLVERDSLCDRLVAQRGGCRLLEEPRFYQLSPRARMRGRLLEQHAGEARSATWDSLATRNRVYQLGAPESDQFRVTWC